MKINKIPLLLGVAAIFLSGRAAQGQTYQNPFLPTSVWNLPISANATYEAANLGTLGAIGNDNEFIYETSSSNPFYYVYQPPQYGSYQKPGVYIPSNLIINPNNIPNGCASFLMPDGMTIQEYNLFSRTTAGSSPIGLFYGYLNLFGTGQGAGGHAGSGLSVLGGSIRQGELESGNPIRHAVKIELDWAQLYRNSNANDNNQETFRWPAINSDGNSTNTSDGGGYTGGNSALRMGSLLAIPSNININNLGLSPHGLQIAAAMQNYGAYVVDTSGNHYTVNNGYTMNICAEEGEETDYFPQDNGGYFGANPYGNNNLFNDMAIIYPYLEVVTSNYPPGPAGYSYVTNENLSQTFSQPVNVAFGAYDINGYPHFYYKYGVTGTVNFSTSTFGDPFSGVVKAGYVQNTSNNNPTGPAGYTYVTSENGSADFTQSENVAFGAYDSSGNPHFIYQTNVSGNITFNNATFTDPLSGTLKSGFVQVSSNNPSGPAGYTYVTGENGSANLPLAKNVAFGAYDSNGNPHFSYETGAIGTVNFNNSTFTDPLPGTAKAGFIESNPTAPAGYSYVTNENGIYNFPSPTNVAFGAYDSNGNPYFYYRSNVTGVITFNNATFGDPLQGAVKAGFVQNPY